LFPEQFAACETEWAERTVRQAVVAARDKVPADPSGATNLLRQTAVRLSDMGNFPGAQKLLLDGRRQVVQARLDGARREARALVAKDRFREVSELARRFEEELRQEAAEVGEGPTLTKFREMYGFLGDVAERVARGVAPGLLALGCSVTPLPGDVAVSLWLRSAGVPVGKAAAGGPGR
jgi:hypothetical protein